MRYKINEALSFEHIEKALSPDSSDKIKFSRYTPKIYLKQPEAENQRHLAEGVAGLLRSNLLKRFESSAFAFSKSLKRMITQHDLFLKALDNGKVISTKFLQELSDDDETAFEEILQE